MTKGKGDELPERRQADVPGVKTLTSESDLEEEEIQEGEGKARETLENPKGQLAFSPKGNQ